MAPVSDGLWLVTGASRGLGREIALGLAARGRRVLATARDPASLATLVAKAPDAIVALPLDLADAAAIRPALDQAIATGGSFSGVINNAGIGSYRAFLDHSESELLAILQVNLGAVMQICRALLPGMLARGSGHIINIGSDLGRRPLAKMAPYVASKHGLAGFSHSLLREVKGSGVRVSLVQPGLIDTGFGGRTPGEIDAAQCLAPAELARIVLDLIDSPPTLVVDELTVHPLGQADF
jgi:short-subunit dehydrogenase